jgi:lipopolysaccharide export system protein LptA
MMFGRALVVVAGASIGMIAACQAAQPAAKSSAGFDFANQNSAVPVQIFADQGLEMSQDAKTVIGRVNAKAVRGDVTLYADVLIAHFRDKKLDPAVAGAAGADPKKSKVPKAVPVSADGAAANPAVDPVATSGTEVWRVEAHGHVVIKNPNDTAYGDDADYNIDDAVVVLTGKDLKLVTPSEVITARDSLEYWENRQQAVARGDAVAVQEEKRLQGDVLTAEFAKDPDGRMQIKTMHAFNHAIVTTPTEVVTGDRGEYNLENGIVTLTGSVKMTRDKNQLDGGYAIVNLNSGISQVFPAPPGKAGSQDRVKALLVPQKRDSPSQPSAAPGQ